MELIKKLEILADAAKYDVSCSSSGSSRKNVPGGIGNGHASGICHSWSADGRCISLLKILFTNECVYDCAYCVNRCSNDIPRASFTPEEVADLTINFYRRNYIEGLFLSSAVIKNPNHTMEQMNQAIRKLRTEYRFNGYIHLKAIPGADSQLIQEAGSMVDRMSVNIELPSSEGLQVLAPQKKKDAILKPMSFLKSQIITNKEEKKLYRNAPSFVPAGQSTQLIVGATPDPDMNILRLSEGLYRRFSLKRVYYSAYVPISSNPKLPTLAKPPLLREHRLYQADWLLRFYGFTAGELLDEQQPNFDMQLDPKCLWALRNIDQFPVEVNRADYHTLLRIPGIGVRSANRIVAARRVGSLRYEHLKKLGVVLKRARFFITCQGQFFGESSLHPASVRKQLVAPDAPPDSRFEQLSLFSPMQDQPTPEDAYASISGEL